MLYKRLLGKRVAFSSLLHTRLLVVELQDSAKREPYTTACEFYISATKLFFFNFP
jgi:hypothetical protein